MDLSELVEAVRRHKRIVIASVLLAVMVAGLYVYTRRETRPPDKFRAAMAALEKEIARFTEPTYITTRELEAVKAQRAVSSAFGIEKASEIAHTIGFWWSVASLDYFMGYTDTMAQQRITDLMRYTSTYIAGKPRVVNVLLSNQARRIIGLTEQELLAPVKSGIRP